MSRKPRGFDNARFFATMHDVMRSRCVLLVVPVLLAACAKPVALPHQEVLERAAIASQRLQSSSFALRLRGTYHDALANRAVESDIMLEGVFQRGGDMLSADGSATFRWEDGNERTVRLDGAVSTVGPHETYLRLDELGLEPQPPEDSPFLQLQPLIGSWFLLPSAEGQDQPPALRRFTPETEFLKQQASVVSVTDDRGVERLDGGYAYHYKVTIDAEEFAALFPAEEDSVDVAALAVEGDLWIDARSFYLRKAEWHVARVPFLAGTAEGTLTVVLTDHDAAPEVTVPLHPVILDPESFLFSDDAAAVE